jgi:hypothetical protein
VLSLTGRCTQLHLCCCSCRQLLLEGDLGSLLPTISNGNRPSSRDVPLIARPQAGSGKREARSHSWCPSPSTSSFFAIVRQEAAKTINFSSQVPARFCFFNSDPALGCGASEAIPAHPDPSYRSSLRFPSLRRHPHSRASRPLFLYRFRRKNHTKTEKAPATRPFPSVLL